MKIDWGNRDNTGFPFTSFPTLKSLLFLKALLIGTFTCLSSWMGSQEVDEVLPDYET